MDKLTTLEIAEKMGQSPSTIKHWQKKYGIQKELKKGKAFYLPEHIPIFEAVKEELAKGAGERTIRKRIGSDNTQPLPEQRPDNSDTGETIAEQRPDNAPPIDDRIRVILRDELTQQNDLAEKYARATYRIGELEAEARGYQAQITAQAEQLALLPAPGELERLQAELERERAKTWWQKLVGG